MHVIIHFWHWLYQQVKGWVNEAVARHLKVHTEELKRHISAEHEKSRALNKPKPTRKPKDAPTD